MRTGEYEHGVNRQWLLVDRVVAERPHTSMSSGVEYLVKWKDLGYDQCT